MFNQKSLFIFIALAVSAQVQAASYPRDPLYASYDLDARAVADEASSQPAAYESRVHARSWTGRSAFSRRGRVAERFADDDAQLERRLFGSSKKSTTKHEVSHPAAPPPAAKPAEHHDPPKPAEHHDPPKPAEHHDPPKPAAPKKEEPKKEEPKKEEPKKEEPKKEEPKKEEHKPEPKKEEHKEEPKKEEHKDAPKDAPKDAAPKKSILRPLNSDQISSAHEHLNLAQNLVDLGMNVKDRLTGQGSSTGMTGDAGYSDTADTAGYDSTMMRREFSEWDELA